MHDPVRDLVWMRSGYTNEFNGGQAADAWEQGVKVVCICDAVQIFETSGVYYTSSVPYEMKIVSLPV